MGLGATPPDRGKFTRDAATRKVTSPPSNETSLLQIIIGLNDLTQLLLRASVAAVGVRMVKLDQFLEPRLDLVLRRTLLQSPSVVIAFFSSGRSCRRFSTGVERDCRARQAKNALGSLGGGSSPAAAGSAVSAASRGAPVRPCAHARRPRIGRHLPGRPVSGQSILLESRRLRGPTSRRNNYRSHCTRARDRRRKRSIRRPARVLSAHDGSPAGRTLSAGSEDRPCAFLPRAHAWCPGGWS